MRFRLHLFSAPRGVFKNLLNLIPECSADEPRMKLRVSVVSLASVFEVAIIKGCSGFRVGKVV